MDYDPDVGEDENVTVQREFTPGPSLTRLEQLSFQTPPFDVILDGSLFTSGALEDTVQLIQDQTNADVNCFISSKFVETIEHYMENGRKVGTDALSFYEAYDDFGELENVRDSIVSLQSLQVFDVSELYGPGDVEGTYYDEYQSLVSSLGREYRSDEGYEPILDRGTRLGDILFEELVFGLTHSSISSRLKKVYRKFAAAVGPVFEIPVENIEDIHEELSEVANMPEQEFQNLFDELSGSAEQTHLDAINEIEEVRSRFKEYSPNWVGTPMKYTVPVLVGAFLSPYGFLSGMAGQVASIGGTLLTYDGCVWLADP